MIGLIWFRLMVPQAAWTDPIPHTDVNPYGANFFLDREMEPWKQEKTLEMARAAGIGSIKQQFPWETIEPLRKGEFDWARYDRIVDLAEQYGMQIIARLDRPPDWTRRDNRFKTRPPDDLADYGDFVYAVVQRYSGRVRYVQIWNEPNLAAEWGFQPADAVAYTRLLEVAYRRAKQADPNTVILSAPLAITLEDVSMRGNQNDLTFLEQMYQAGAGNYFDVLSANAFGLGYAPEDPPNLDALNFRRVELQRRIMERYGDADKPIWINEYGWNAPPASFPPELLIWARVTEVQQADYTVRGIEWAQKHWPWLGVVNIWYFRQAGDIPPDRPAYYFALVDPEFNPRPVYEALCQTTQGINVATTGLHQETSAGVSAPGWRLVLDPAASAGAVLVADEDASTLTFTFEGPQVALVTRQGPDQGRLLVQVDGQPPDGFPLDDQGRALVDLSTGKVRKRVTLTLARDLNENPHCLTLTPDSPAPVAVDAFIVSGIDKPFLFYTLWGLCGAVFLIGVIVGGKQH